MSEQDIRHTENETNTDLPEARVHQMRSWTRFPGAIARFAGSVVMIAAVLVLPSNLVECKGCGHKYAVIDGEEALYVADNHPGGSVFWQGFRDIEWYESEFDVSAAAFARTKDGRHIRLWGTTTIVLPGSEWGMLRVHHLDEAGSQDALEASVIRPALEKALKDAAARTEYGPGPLPEEGGQAFLNRIRERAGDALDRELFEPYGIRSHPPRIGEVLLIRPEEMPKVP